jgi:hypothetical protein
VNGILMWMELRMGMTYYKINCPNVMIGIF